MPSCIPPNGTLRLEALARYAILDTAPEASFERITTLAARLFAVPIALITLVDQKRQWFKSCLGMDRSETPRDIAFCAHTILSNEVLMVPDTTLAARFCDNPQVTGAPSIRFYAGAPLVTGDGFRLGALCIIDTAPRQLSLAQKNTLQDLAGVVIEAFEARRTSHRMADEIAERERVEAALRDAKQQAEEARIDAEQANEAKSEFLSRMSHELRTPLNAVLGYGQLLEVGPREPQELHAVQAILHGGRHLLTLVDELLDLARVENGEFQPTVARVDLGQLARDCVNLLDPSAQAQKITCEVQMHPEAANLLWTDELRVRQALLNLLANAIKYNREGGKVVLSAEELSSGRIRLKVTDTGWGIPPEQVAHLFIPFKRLPQTRGVICGTGLGLVISQQIARALGGSIGVESTVGRGSTFWIELPSLDAPEMSLLSACGGELPTPPDETRQTATLLYIEDNRSNLEVVQALFASHRPRWQLWFAENGRAGLRKASQLLPDLILLDLQLPDISGAEVLTELRRTPRLQRVPVIILSADATARTRESVLAAGACDYISKPFEVSVLLERLDRALEKAVHLRPCADQSAALTAL